MSLDPTRRTRVAAYALIIDKETILLCRLAASVDPRQRWTLPGGGIDFGESPSAAVVREVKEETGFDIDLGELLGVDDFMIHKDSVSHHNIRIIYHAKIKGGTMTHELHGSTDKCEWRSLSEMGTLPVVELVERVLAMR